jgi:hypothetical protein
MDQLGRLPLRVLSIDNMLSKKKVCTLGGPKPHSRSISLAWYSCLSRQLPVSNCTHRLVLCQSQPPVSCATQGGQSPRLSALALPKRLQLPSGQVHPSPRRLASPTRDRRCTEGARAPRLHCCLPRCCAHCLPLRLPGSFRAVSGVSSDRPLRNTMRAGTRRPCPVLRLSCGILGP